MSDETIYQHGDTRIDVGTLTGDLRVFDKGDLMAIVDDGGYVQEAIERLRDEHGAQESLISDLRSQLADANNHHVEMQRHRDAWRKYAYGRGERPQDFLDGNMVPSDRGMTRIEELEAASIIDFDARDRYLTRIEELERDLHLAEEELLYPELPRARVEDQMNSDWEEALDSLVLSYEEGQLAGWEVDRVRTRVKMQIGSYRTMLERVANELGDPMGKQWCDRPDEDCKLLESLHRDVVSLLGIGTNHERCTTPDSSDQEIESDQFPDDYEPVYATFHFYHNDPDSMQRMRECLDAPRVKAAVRELEEWLKRQSDSENPEYAYAIDMAREKLFDIFNARGLDPWCE